MSEHRIRAEIVDEFTRTAKTHIERGDLKRYTVDEVYIYKLLTQEEYEAAIKAGENEPFIMKELGIEATYDFNYKP